MSEHFSAWIQNRTEFEKGNPAGIWLDLPATKDQLHEAMKALNITALNPQDFRLHGHFVTDSKKVEIPLDLLQEPDFDTLNFLAARLEALAPVQLEKLNAMCRSEFCPQDLKRFLDYPDNTDCFVYVPGVLDYKDLGDYYLNDSGMVQMPEEWKAGIDREAFGRNAAAQEQGHFTEQGYLVLTGDEWQVDFEENGVPDKYRVMSFPEPEHHTPEKLEKEAVPTLATATQNVAAANPARPIELKAEKPAEKLKEITDKLEQGIQELFDSDRFKAYLKVMSKFHNYSVNNTLLIAMQKPDASYVAGYNSWKNLFDRQVMKGAKGIKVIAPSPFKVKKEMEKIDPQTQKPVMGKNGKPVTQEVEITVPAFKVVSVFDVSQTEGKELPSIGIDELTGNVEKYNDYFKAITQTSPVPVGFEKIEGGSHGYYHLEDKRIAINEGMSELQNLKTLIHEIAHAKLHDVDLKAPAELTDRPDRRTREVQAESVAYAVCQHYGLDTSDYSFAYIATWSSGRELSELKASLETIRSAASELIKDIDKNFAELSQNKEQGKEAPAAKEAQPELKKTTPKKTLDFDMEKAIVYLQDLQKKAAAADPNKKAGIATYNMTLKRLQKLSGEIPESYAELKSLVEAAAISPDLSTLKERMTELCQTLPQKEAENTFSIYQLKENTPVEYHFRPLNELQEKGLTVDPANYNEVYTAPLTPDMTLEGIYEKFNIAHPKDFTGHSLSVSDIVTLHQNGSTTAHYVDSIGFSDITQAFQKENPLEAAEKSTEQNYNMIDGQINNTPAADELEARVKAGEQISLTELAEAVKQDKAAAKAEPKKPGRKPSIRKQLQEGKEQTKAAPKKQPARSKKTELERS